VQALVTTSTELFIIYSDSVQIFDLQPPHKWLRAFWLSNNEDEPPLLDRGFMAVACGGFMAVACGPHLFVLDDTERVVVYHTLTGRPIWTVAGDCIGRIERCRGLALAPGDDVVCLVLMRTLVHPVQDVLWSITIKMVDGWTGHVLAVVQIPFASSVPEKHCSNWPVCAVASDNSLLIAYEQSRIEVFTLRGDAGVALLPRKKIDSKCCQAGPMISRLPMPVMRVYVRGFPPSVRRVESG
jgi:hypothetical protein